MPVTGNNILQKRKIIDDSFQEAVPESYDLYIFIDADEISCAAAERRGKNFLALESWDLREEASINSETLNLIREESKLLSLSGYPRVICCCGFSNATLVPTPLFNAGNAADQLHFATKQATTDHLVIDQLRRLEAFNIFTLSPAVFDTFNSWFPAIEFHHASTSLIEYLVTVNKNSKEESVTVNVHHSCIEILVTRGNQLLLYNRFMYDTPEELVYYLLFVCEQLHLNPDHIKVQFAGEITNDDAAFRLALKYIRNAMLAERPDLLSYSSGFNELPGTIHFNLFSQVICAS